jgi:uncharacterized protein (DUF4415 family)
MKRTELEALGMTKEQIDAVMKINGDDIENAKAGSAAEITNLKAENDTLSKQVKDRDKQIDTLKASVGDNEELKKQIETLQADNKAKDEAHAKELTQLKIDAAVEKALTDGGAKNIKAVKALLDLTDAKLGDDGTVKGLTEQIDKLKADEGSKFMFNATEQKNTQQTFTGFQPGTSTTVPDSKQAGYEARLAEARKNNNQLEVIKIKQEAFNDGGIVLM